MKNGLNNYQANLKIVDIKEAELKSPHDSFSPLLPICDFSKEAFL